MSLESFTYGSETVGGSTPTRLTEVLDSYMFITSQDEAEFVVRFAVRVVPSGNAGTDYNALASSCQAVESALRTRYQKLTVDWGASNQETFDPDVTAGSFPSSGFSQEPHLEKLRDFPNSGCARGYELRVRLGQYPNYTDAYGAANGRRQVDVAFRFDTEQRLIVTMSGQWTQVPASLARAKFLAIFDGNTGYASYRLGLINSTVPGQATDTWSLTRRVESDPNDLSTLTFEREYQQHINGRRGSVVEVFFGPQGLRTVTIRGTYLRTVLGTNYGIAADSLTNFLDATNGGQAYAEATQLPGLTLPQGGPLNVGQNCELATSPFQTTNEQLDKTEYSFVYQELIQKQSQASGAYLDDPNIVGDTIRVSVKFNEVNDSPAPPSAASIPGPNGSTPASGGGGNNGGAPGTTTVGVPSTVSPNAATNPGTQSGPGQSGAASVVPVKPVDLSVSYDAFFKTTVLDCYTYWRSEVLPLLLETLTEEFGLTGAEFISCEESTDRTKNRVTAEIRIRSYSSNVILFAFTLGITNDLGIRADPAFTGTPHDYLVQQGLPKTTMLRKVEAVYKAGSFSLDQFITPPALTGWVPLANSQPSTVTRTLGIPDLGVPQTQLTYAVLEEPLLWVRSNVANMNGGGSNVPTGGGGGGPVATGGGGSTVSPPAVPPAIATGVG